MFGKRASSTASVTARRSARGPSRRGSLRVLLSGGSTTFDVLAPDDAATWPRLLETRLRAGESPVEVWNAGFPGWTSQENVISLAIRDLDLAPDLASSTRGSTISSRPRTAVRSRMYEHGHAELARRALGSSCRRRRGSAVRCWPRSSAGWGRAADPWQALAGAAGSGPRRERIAPEGIAAFERNVRSFAALARSRGAGVLLVTQPVRIRAASRDADLSYLAGWYPELLPTAAPEELERLNGVVRRLAGEGLAGLADGAREIDWRDGDFGDPMHYTDSGRRKLVDYLAPRISKRLAALSAAAVPPSEDPP